MHALRRASAKNSGRNFAIIRKCCQQLRLDLLPGYAADGMSGAEQPDRPELSLVEWNRRRARFARKHGLPFFPVEDDRDAPEPEEAQIRAFLEKRLVGEEARRIADYCWRYPKWIRVLSKVMDERYWLDRALREPLAGGGEGASDERLDL